jgi:hypothetical protein
MEPILVGYFPKQVCLPPPSLTGVGIEEVGSVSRCIASGPVGWFDLGKHNAWGCYGDPDTAWSLVPPDQQADYRLCAYEVYPMEFFDGAAHALEIAPPAVTPLAGDFRAVGWDAVSRSGGQGFECSPLSCNYMVERYTVNAYCLVNLQDAQNLAATAEREGCEPGPYVVVNVWQRDV